MGTGYPVPPQILGSCSAQCQYPKHSIYARPEASVKMLCSEALAWVGGEKLLTQLFKRGDIYGRDMT